MSLLFRVTLIFGVLSAYVSADEPKPKFKLEDAGWLTGTWKSLPTEKMKFEEHWSAPAAGGMMGMFRLLTNDKVGVYEYLLLEQETDGVVMRLRHYRPGMVQTEAEPIRCRLIEATPQKLIFENPDHAKPKKVSYVLDDQKQLTVSVETTRDGKSSTFVLKFQR